MNDTANATPDGAPPLVVVGTSAGGNETLGTLLDGLPGELAACILIVRHLPPEGSIGYLIKQLESRTRLACREGKDGDPLVPGTVYFAPPDHHLLVDESKVWVVRGARENRWRPAIDPLFRSAAVSHRERVAGVVLTGHLDDGAAGLSAIKRCGGVCIVQDPDDASFPDMPRNALQRVEVDHCVPAGSIGGVIGGWLENGFGKSAGAVPEDLETEARIARGALAEVACVEKTGTSTALTCPVAFIART